MARLQVLVVLKIQSDSIKDISLICKLPFLYQRRNNFLYLIMRVGRGKWRGGGVNPYNPPKIIVYNEWILIPIILFLLTVPFLLPITLKVKTTGKTPVTPFRVLGI